MIPPTPSWFTPILIAGDTVPIIGGIKSILAPPPSETDIIIDGSIHLLLQVVIRELTSGEELVKDVEVIPRVQRQEAKLRQQCHGAVLHAAEQVGEIAVEVVVDFHAAALDGTAHGHRAAAAKHIDEAGVAVRHQLVDDRSHTE